MAAGLKSREKLLLNERCERCPSLTDKMQPVQHAIIKHMPRTRTVNGLESSSYGKEMHTYRFLDVDTIMITYWYLQR